MSKQIIKDPKTGELQCKRFKQCGGCQLRESYADQLERKQGKAERMLSKFAKVQPIIAMDKPYNYRNKVQNVYGYDASKRIISGVFQSTSRRLIAVDDCMLEDRCASPIVSTIKKLMKSFRITPYDQNSGKGLLRHTLIRNSMTTGEIMLVLVTASPVFPAKKNFVNAMLKAHPEITTIVQNICTNKLPLTMGTRDIVMYGKGYIEDELCGCRFKISPRSFYQVNSIQTEKLYTCAVEAAGMTKGTKVIDAYCGTGTIGIICAKNGARVVGTELNSAAAADAAANAKLNGLDNIRFYNEDAGDFMHRLAASGETCDVLILDPPRAGASREFIAAAGKLSPEKIVYVSCKIETLERDLRLFKKEGYKAQFIQPVDMFPHTTGIETVCLLSKLKSTHHIEVEIELDKMDLTKAESKATYAEIKEYVLDKYDLKVSQLYIAQVKRKHGIIERINYNIGKGKNRVPQVTPEKEAAIEDALRHFKMIE